MATTTAVNSYRSAGQPDDSVGSVGDICWDTSNRCTWVKQSGNTWVGGAYSNIGPVGPAMLSGSGSPASGYGQIGNGYTDVATGNTYLKSSSGWSQTGSIVGPTGATGTTLMSALATGAGPNGAFSGVTLSSTPYAVPYPGSTVASQFSPQGSSAFMGVYAYCSVACTLSLYNVTASSTVWSVSISAGATIGNQNYTATQYPLISGNVYQWQVTGSASATFQMLPFYLMPSNSNSPCIGMAGPAGYATSQTFSSTAAKIPVFGSAAGVNSWGYAPPRAGGVYSAQATYTPTGSTSSSASVSIQLNYGAFSNGQGGACNITPIACTANGLPQTIITPRLTDQASTFSTGYFFYWTVTGSGSGTLVVNLLPII